MSISGSNVMRPLVHNLKTKDVKVKIVKKDGTELKGKAGDYQREQG